jgi:hypothetical protein
LQAGDSLRVGHPLRGATFPVPLLFSLLGCFTPRHSDGHRWPEGQMTEWAKKTIRKLTPQACW